MTHTKHLSTPNKLKFVFFLDRYLTIGNTRAKLNKNSLSVSMHTGDEGCWFRVVPSFKAQAIGDAVAYSSLVSLFSTKREVYLDTGEKYAIKPRLASVTSSLEVAIYQELFQPSP